MLNAFYTGTNLNDIVTMYDHFIVGTLRNLQIIMFYVSVLIFVFVINIIKYNIVAYEFNSSKYTPGIILSENRPRKSEHFCSLKTSPS